MNKIETHTRLYRGEPKNATGGQGHHYTRILDKAKGFAGPKGKVYYVDVHMNDMGSLKPSRVPGMNYVVPEKMRNERKLMEETLAQKKNKKAQIKYKVIDESFLKRTMLSILEDESRREHDANWVKPKKKKEKAGETKVVFEPPMKKPTEEGK